MTEQKPTVGRIVHYTLNEADAAAINSRRKDFEAHRRVHTGHGVAGGPGRTGHVAHVGNQVRADETYAAVVVRVFDPASSTANLQVLLDGTDTYWATSRTEGDGPGHWSWPPRS